ncbi:axonemal dynein light intermediate polypeptide 1 [Thraustotheca clavata]|uniref:Axonemal dynein light intermediate polypeptide 1 n=1 Tax=Thraustotheca clavata TaxID=74557 RepID=A0A1W0AA42_9STRA|nr:axonemal dynein light intermediate polypeptide 1 [Thraustotheca clavata]
MTESCKGIPHPPFSLIQYDEPILVEANPHIDYPSSPLPSDTSSAINTTAETVISPEILRAMLPPREWKEFSGTWRQNVSCIPTSRTDVVALQEKLDASINNEQAKKSGVCANRERLHAQVFDEIIRQVTLACPERGLLLLRIRDEIRMTIEAYQALYNTSLSFGIRKTVMAEEGMQQIEDKLASLKKENKELRETLLQWTHYYKVLENRYATEQKNRTMQENNVVTLLQDQLHHFKTFGELNDLQ